MCFHELENIYRKHLHHNISEDELVKVNDIIHYHIIEPFTVKVDMHNEYSKAYTFVLFYDINGRDIGDSGYSCGYLTLALYDKLTLNDIIDIVNDEYRNDENFIMMIYFVGSKLKLPAMAGSIHSK